MPRDIQQIQARSVTAVENTKHHYGLWRGQLVHPQFGVVTDEGEPSGVTMTEILAGEDPITDAKGLGIRLSWRAPTGVIPHFFIRDEHYFEVMRSAYPAFHNAAVRVLAAHIRAEGYAGLRKLVFCKAFLKKPFAFGGVYTERNIGVNGVIYRPDIVVEHAVAGYPRIELEVVNRHPPEADRLRAACAEGALVLTMDIYDLVQHYVLDGRSRSFVPPDDELLARLKRLRFADVKRGDSTGHHEFHARWLDREQAPYLRALCAEVNAVTARVESKAGWFAGLSGLQVLDTVWAFRLPPDQMDLARMEDWVLRQIGLRFGFDDRVVMPAIVCEADKVLKNWAGASVVPPGITEALKDLKAARKLLNSAICDLLYAAETLWKSAVLARKEEIAEEIPRSRTEAARRFRLQLLAVEQGFKPFKNAVEQEVGAVRVHRRGALAGAIGHPNNLRRLSLVSQGQRLHEKLRYAYRFAYQDADGQPLRDLLALPDDAFLPPALRREVDALAETLNSPDLPAEQDIIRLVNALTERNEAR